LNKTIISFTDISDRLIRAASLNKLSSIDKCCLLIVICALRTGSHSVLAELLYHTPP